MAADLDAIPWNTLHHAGGVADDVPDMLRALDDPEFREEAVDALLGAVFDYDEDAGTVSVFDCTPHVIPFVAAFVDREADDPALEEDQADLSDALAHLGRLVAGSQEPLHVATRDALAEHASWTLEQA